MDPERWQAVERIYHEALQLSESERADFVCKACGEDPELRSEVDSLLRYAGKPAQFIDTPAMEVVAEAMARKLSAAESENPPKMIGAAVGQYRIVEQLGAGGMGEVYLAVRADEQFQRRVAIKVVRAGNDSNRIISRFKNERQILASLDHPNIARLLDGGTTSDGLPYFVMELVDGDPIDRYCESRGLNIKQRLKIFLQVCSALQYAHQRQIIHRDIKPSNILVTTEGMPKLLDFGIAKILDAGFDAGATGPTETQFRVFTPLFASPEQIKGQPVAASSDVYSMGVLLYILLTGQKPYRFRTNTPAEIERVICEEDPVKPSTAVVRSEEQVQSAVPSSRRDENIGVRGADSRHLQKDLRGDLDAIVMMALRKEPERRYVSITELSDDVGRHLEGRPIHARASSVAYRASKFIRRHRELAAGALLSAMLLGGLFAWRGQHQGAPPTPKAVGHPARRSIAVLGFKNLSEQPHTDWLSTALSEMLTTELTAGEKLRTVPEADVAQARADLSLPDVDKLTADNLDRLHKQLGTDLVVSGSYLALESKAGSQIRLDLRLQDAANGSVVASMSETGSQVQLLDLVSRAGEQLRSKLGMERVSSADAETVGASLPSSLEALRLYSEGLSKFRTFDSLGARDQLQKAVVSDPRFAPGRSALAEVWSSLGYDQKAKDEAKKAFDLSKGLPREDQLLIEARYRGINNENDRALEIYKSLFDKFPDNLDYGLNLVEAQRNASKGNDSPAILNQLRKLPAPMSDDPRIDLFDSYVQSGLTNFKLSQAAAESAVTKATALGERLVVAEAYHQEGQDLYAMGDVDQARGVLESASNMFEAVGDKFLACENYVSLAQLAYLQTDLTRAKVYLNKALSVAREIGSRNALMVAQNVMGNIMRSEGDLKGAGLAYGESVSIAQELNEEPAQVSPLDGLGWVEFDVGNLPKARQRFEQLIALAQKIHNSASIGLGNTGLGRIALAQGELASARQHYSEAARIFEQSKQKYRIAKGNVLLSYVALAEGHPEEVAGPIKEAKELFQASKSSNGAVLAATVMAQALLVEGKTNDAQKELDAVAGSLSIRLPIDTLVDNAVVQAQVHAALGNTAQAIKELNSSLEGATIHGFFPQQFDARLALAKVEMMGGKKALAQQQLDALRRDADSKGFHLVAHEAAKAAARKESSHH